MTFRLPVALAALIAIAPATPLASQSNYTYRHTTHDNGRALDISVRGRVWFTDDDADIARIEEGGRFTIEERRRGFPDRMLIITPGPGGRLERTFILDGRTAEYAGAGAAWFASLLPDLIREWGIGAEDRARRILARDGVAGVIREAERIRSSSNRRRYLTIAIDEGRPAGADAVRVLRAVEPIGSSSEKATLLLAAAARIALDDPEARRAYFDAAGSIGSSSELRRVLAGVLGGAQLAEPVLIDVLFTSRRIASGSERGAVLTQVAQRHRLTTDALREAFFSSANDISSSSQRRQVLVALLRAQGTDEAVVRDVVRSARSISSSSEKAAVLVEATSRSVPPS